MRRTAPQSRLRIWPRFAAFLAAIAVVIGGVLPGLHARIGCDSSPCSPTTHADHHDSCSHADGSRSDAPPTHDDASCEICKLILAGAAGAPLLDARPGLVGRATTRTFLPPTLPARARTVFLEGLPARGPPAI